MLNPVKISDEIKAKIIGDEEQITCRPADNIAPELDVIKEKCNQYIEQDEDVLSYALFEQVAEKFFEQRIAAKYKVDGSLADKDNKVYPV